MKIYTRQIIQLNSLKDKKGEKQRDIEIFSLEGIFLMNQNF